VSDIPEDPDNYEMNDTETFNLYDLARVFGFRNCLPHNGEPLLADI